MLTSCSMTSYGCTSDKWFNSLWPGDTIRWQEIWVNTDSGNGLLPDSTTPLPESMLTNHQWGVLAFTWGQFYRKCWGYLFLIWIWKWLIYNYSCLSQDKMSYNNLLWRSTLHEGESRSLAQSHHVLLSYGYSFSWVNSRVLPVESNEQDNRDIDSLWPRDAIQWLRWNGCHFANDSLKYFFFYENVWI